MGVVVAARRAPISSIISNGTRVAKVKRMRFLAALALAGCGSLVENGGFDIYCGGVQDCKWTVVEGDGRIGPGWHDSDPAMDLGPGHVVVEQHDAPFQLFTLGFVLQAAIACDADASVRFELAWYQGSTLIDTRPVVVYETGVFAVNQLVAAPSLAADGLIFRIVKDGAGSAIVDQISLVPEYP